jgi:hypothetical protein
MESRELPEAIGNYVSQWASCALDFFEKTDYIVSLLLTFYNYATFNESEEIIKNYLRKGLPSADQEHLLRTDVKGGKYSNEDKAKRNAIVRKLNRLFLRLRNETFPNENLSNPFVTPQKAGEQKVDDIITGIERLEVSSAVPRAGSPSLVQTENSTSAVVREAPQTPAVDVCFVCLNTCRQKLSCGHLLHRACKKKMIEHQLFSCGECKAPFFSEREMRDREYEAVVNNIIYKLSNFVYDIDRLYEVDGFLEG